MNGYEMLAESYKKAAEEKLISRTEAEKQCKALDFLAKCDDEDIYNLFDSSAFNEITMCYVRKAVRELTDEDTLTEEQAMSIRNRVNLLFSEITAKDISEN